MFHRQFSWICNVTQVKMLFGGWQQRKEQRKSGILLEYGLINNETCHTGRWSAGLPSLAETQAPPSFLILLLCWGWHERPWFPFAPAMVCFPTSTSSNDSLFLLTENSGNGFLITSPATEENSSSIFEILNSTSANAYELLWVYKYRILLNFCRNPFG